ncbi:MAG: HAD-IA family hydrolase, partial [Armatimonadota bacterium]
MAVRGQVAGICRRYRRGRPGYRECRSDNEHHSQVGDAFSHAHQRRQKSRPQSQISLATGRSRAALPALRLLAQDGYIIEGIAFFRPESRDLFSHIDTIIFDIDGVLLEVSRSIRKVNCLSVAAYLRTLPGWTAPDDLLTSQDIEQFKEAGGFNDDWDLTFAVVLLFLHKWRLHHTSDASVLHTLSPTVAEYTTDIARRGGWLRSAEAITRDADLPSWPSEWYDKPKIQQMFQELWSGEHCQRLYGFEPQFFPGPGWIRLDTPLLDAALIPKGVKLGVVTGRTLREAQFALELLGLQDRISLPGPQGITKDDGFYKPEPLGMRQVLTRLESRTALYIGDTIDDLRTVLSF